MTFKAIAVALVIVFALPVSAGTPRSPYQAGYNRAIRHGYTPAQASCYGNLFSQQAFLNSRGHYTVATGKGRRGPFRALAWQQCQISV